MPKAPRSEQRFSRREMLEAAALLAALPAGAVRAATGRIAASNPYPREFLWGVATAGHQVEGNSANDDVWLLEQITPTVYKEKSGNADDHYRLFERDIALVAALGFNTYRFSIEWSRIEPAEGEFSLAELDHYRRVLASCHKHGLTPVVTFNHFAIPRWLAARGGWENPASPALFERYCDRAARHLGDLIAVASTLNEPNIGLVIADVLPPPARMGIAAMLRAAGAATGSPRFCSLVAGDQALQQPNLLAAHAAGRAAIKAVGPSIPVGFTLAMSDDQTAGPDSIRDAWRARVYGAWFDAARQDDYLGVQTYTRSRIGPKGTLPPELGTELTQMGYEFWPDALGQTIRYAHGQTGKPIYVTENGIATEDDSRRVVYIDRALAGVAACLRDGIPVKSYIHWSLLDSYEWSSGYRPKFGLVAVDRTTQLRTPKPSARHLGALARTNAAARA